MNKIGVALGFIIVMCSPCFAQSGSNETLTIVTYYPSPYGVYRNLRLNPSNQPAAGSPAEQAGTMYFNGTELFIYKGDTVKTWQPVGGPWTSDSGNNITNANSGNVVIAKGALVLPVMATVPSSAKVDGALRFTGSGFEGYYNGKWNSLATTAAINGSCGPSGCGASPSCAAGTLSGSSSNTNTYTWKCLGIGGGTNSTCSAPIKPGVGKYAGGCPACLTTVSCRYQGYSGSGDGRYYCSNYVNANGCGPWPASHPVGCYFSDTSTWYTTPPTGSCSTNSCFGNTGSTAGCTSPLTVIECNCQ
jgi:hypothetical protein